MILHSAVCILYIYCVYFYIYLFFSFSGIPLSRPRFFMYAQYAREINSSMPAYVLDRIETIMGEHGLTDWSRVGLYGLTYKENVDDTRESPTLQLLEVMQRRGIPAPLVYDPMVSAKKAERQCMDFEEFLQGSDIVVLLVGHSQIRQSLPALEGKVVLDTRGIVTDGSAYTL